MLAAMFLDGRIIPLTRRVGLCFGFVTQSLSVIRLDYLQGLNFWHFDPP